MWKHLEKFKIHNIWSIESFSRLVENVKKIVPNLLRSSIDTRSTEKEHLIDQKLFSINKKYKENHHIGFVQFDQLSIASRSIEKEHSID